MPTEIDVVERRIRQLEIERVALAKETDAASAGAPGRPRRGAGQPAASSRGAMKAHWQAEKEAIADIRDAQGGARGPARPSSSARPTSRRRPRSATASIPELERQVDGGHQAPRRAAGRRQQMLKEEVDEEDIAEVVAQVDRRPGQPAHGGRDGQARPPGGACCTSGSSARTRPSPPWPTPSAAAGPACPTPTGPSARSCSSAPPASARPSWPGRWPTSCSTTSGPWSAST